MDCREFRDQHALFIDERCTSLDAFEMRSHMRYCPDCQRHDIVVRRGLLLMRNLPTIEPSAGFRGRLDARLRESAASRPGVDVARVARYAAVAAMLSGITIAAQRTLRARAGDAYRMPPVVASAIPMQPSPFGTQALVATVPTGMSIWPAIMMASQAPTHLVAAELVSER